jgi:hypothetical protein
VIERDVNSFIPFMVKNETHFRLSLLHPYLTLQKADLNMIFVIKYIIYFLPTDQKKMASDNTLPVVYISSTENLYLVIS